MDTTVTRNTTATQPEEAQELATKFSPEQIAFFLECAEKSGLTIEEWLALEPF